MLIYIKFGNQIQSGFMGSMMNMVAVLVDIVSKEKLEDKKL